MNRLADFDPTIPVIAGCMGKAAMDKQHAEAVAARITKFRAAAYHCSTCGQWHVHGSTGLRREKSRPYRREKYPLTVSRATEMAMN